MNKTLLTKNTLTFICQHPNGVTAADFKRAKIPMIGIGRLQQLGVIKGYQVKEQESGMGCWHWLWKPVTEQEGGNNE